MPGQATTYRGLNDMAGWWEWSEEVETNAIGAFQPFIIPGDLCFDIGANRGRKTLIMRWLGARVVAVDPLFAFKDEFVPEFFWKFGKDQDVHWVPRAVSSQAEVTVQVNKFMPWCSSADERWMTESAHAPKFGQTYYLPTSLIERKVIGITLDALIELFGLPRFLKMDVEGAEDDAIGTLSLPVPALNMEFHRDWIPVAALEHMDGLGNYEWNYALGDAGEFVMPEWTCRGKLLDYLQSHLTESGAGSWGDIYGRLTCKSWRSDVYGQPA